jgi:hypothetical protein
VTLYLLKGVTVAKDKPIKTKVDVAGALLCAGGLAGAVFALIEQPHYGWGNSLIYLPLVAGIVLLVGFLLHEKRAAAPMLPLSLFGNRNFSVGNVATLAIYAGLAESTFLLVLYLQQVAGYSALAAGLSLLPVTLILFALSPRFGGLSGKFGPRFFMGFGPLVAGCGFLLMLRLPASVDYWTQLFPAILVFGLGLSMTVAPLTAAILGDVPPEQAGIASAVNNAVSRIAGLVAVAAVGAVVAAQFGTALGHDRLTVPAGTLQKAKQASLVTTPPAPYQHDSTFHASLTSASVSAFHAGVIVVAVLVMAGGVVSLIGIQNPTKTD